MTVLFVLPLLGGTCMQYALRSTRANEVEEAVHASLQNFSRGYSRDTTDGG